MMHILRDTCFVIPLAEALSKAGPYVGPRGGLWADPKHTVHWNPAKHGTERLEAMLADLVPGDKVKEVAEQLGSLNTKQLAKVLADVKGKIDAISARGEGVPITLLRWQRTVEQAGQLKAKEAQAAIKAPKKPKPAATKPKAPEQLGFVLAPPPPKEEKPKPGWERMPEATESARVAAESAIGKRKVTSLVNQGWTFADVMPKNLAQAGTDAGLTRAQAKKMRDTGVSVVRNSNAEPAEPPPPKKPREPKAEPKLTVKAKKKKPTGKRRIEQTGEHIWGSRKDLSGFKIESSKDLDDMTYEDAKFLVTKARLVEPHDLGMFASRDVPPAVAHMAMAMVAAIGAKPVDTPTARATYVEEVREVLGSIKNLRTFDDFSELKVEMRRKMEKSQEWEQVPDSGVMSRADAFSLIDRLQKDNPRMKYSVRSRYGFGGEAQFFVVQKTLRPYDSLGKRFTDFLRARSKNYREAMHEAMKIDSMSTEEGYDYLRTRGTETAKKKKPTKKDLEAARKRLGIDAETERGWSTAKAVAGVVERKGETVKVKSANEKRTKKTFNLREVDFGQEGWMTQADREYHVKALEGAMHDMSEALGVDPAILSLNGRLGVALGARGKGKAAAHYETGRHIINITKFNGGGSLAHEWGHALDNVMATVLIGNQKGDAKYLMEHHGHSQLPPRVRNAITAVHDTIMKAPDPVAAKQKYDTNIKLMNKNINDLISKSNEKVREIRKLHEKPISDGDRLQKLEIAKERMKRMERAGYPPAVERWKGVVKQLEDPTYILNDKERDHLDNLEFDVEILRQTINREKRHYSAFRSLPADASDYARSAMVLGKGYWGNSQELFARAFEAFVQDGLEDNGRRNSYLVDGTRDGGPSGKLGPLFTIMRHPVGEERKRINAAIGELMSALQEEKHLEKALRLMISLEASA
jgi:hypothetical protein